jgi:hypothetical protein
MMIPEMSVFCDTVVRERKKRIGKSWGGAASLQAKKSNCHGGRWNAEKFLLSAAVGLLLHLGLLSGLFCGLCSGRT